MLDPRLYRRGLIVVVLGVIVFAFSFTGPPAPLSPNLAPDVYSAHAVGALMGALVKRFPRRPPGSAADNALANFVSSSLEQSGFQVSRRYDTDLTAAGKRTVQTVLGTRAGLSPRTIALVAPRDYDSGPALADLSGTAVLLELAQVLQYQTHQDTIALVSTTASAGGAGARQAAQALSGQPVDAVIVLGDLVRAQATQPIVVPWSDGGAVAPALLRRTLASAIAQQSGLRASIPGPPSQLAHGALPLTISPQGPFDDAGQPAVMVSAAGERGPQAGEATDPARAGELGAAVLQSVDALGAAGPLPAPSGYLILDGQLVPAWAVRLLVFALILPVMLLAVDGFARARRRGGAVTQRVRFVLASALPFITCLATIRLFALAGAIVAPPEGVGDGAVPLRGGGIALLVLLALELAVGVAWLALRTEWRGEAESDETAGAVLGLVMCVLALAIWLGSPLAALLLVPALHLWSWLAGPERPRAARVALLLGALAPPVLVLAYYALGLGLSPLGLIWTLVLLIGGGGLSLLTAVLWSFALGATIYACTLALRRRPQSVARRPLSVRGPVSYAGPGSLGGTESALRR
jgi:hypothetical protein